MEIIILISSIFTYFLHSRFRLSTTQASLISTLLFIVLAWLFPSTDGNLMITYSFLGSFIGMTLNLNSLKLLVSCSFSILFLRVVPMAPGKLGTVAFLSVISTYIVLSFGKAVFKSRLKVQDN